MYRRLIVAILLCNIQYIFGTNNATEIPKNKVKYKAIILFHGLMCRKHEMTYFISVINSQHPNTTIYEVNILSDLNSYMPIWYQVDLYRPVVERIVTRHPEGVHFIGYSQGGILARAVIETWNDHPVHTFISLIAPQMGASGFPGKNNSIETKGFVAYNLYKIAYTPFWQRVAFFNYWRDINHYDKYLTLNTFLPKLNNEVDHPCAKTFKKNIIRLKQIVLMGIVNDDLMCPWQSSIFGSVDTDGNILNVRQTKIYEDDTLGLRTLDRRGALSTLALEGVPHRQLQFQRAFIIKMVVPWLD